MDWNDHRRSIPPATGQERADPPHPERQHHQHIPRQRRRVMDWQLGRRAAPCKGRRGNRSLWVWRKESMQYLFQLRESLLWRQSGKHLDWNIQRVEPLWQKYGTLPEPYCQWCPERRTDTLFHLVHCEGQPRNAVAGDLLWRRQLFQPRVRDIQPLYVFAHRKEGAEQSGCRPHHRRQGRQSVDWHRRGRTELLQPPYPWVQMVPPGRQPEQHLTQQYQSPLLRCSQRCHLDRNTSGRTEQAGHTFGTLHTLPHESQWSGNTAVGHHPWHRPLPRPTGDSHPKRHLPFQSGWREMPAIVPRQ